MKKIIGVLVLFGIVLLSSVSIISAKDCPDVFEMENKELFGEHRMPIVEFGHKEHTEKYGYSCGSCHHDEEGNKLGDITCSDDIKSCADCHDKPNGNIKSSIDYFSGAIHQNCMGCHKEDNGPVSCTGCHER